MPRFPRESRLLRTEEFRAVAREGISVSTRFMKIAVRFASGKRLGIVTSRAVGNGVTRNRLRRVIREHFRLHADRYPEGDCVVIPRLALAGCDNSDVRRELETLLGRLLARV